MTKYNALSKLAVAVLAIAAPTQQAVASSQESLNYTLVASSDPADPLTKNFSGPPPKFFDAIYFNRFLEEPSVIINTPIKHLNASYIGGYGLYDYSFMKARLTSQVDLSGTAREYNELISSSASMSISTRDNISFFGIGAGNTATLYLGNYADISTHYDEKYPDKGDYVDGIQVFKNSQFSFTSKALIFENINDYLSERARPKFSHQFTACDGTRLCQEADVLREGNKKLATFFEVDSDDVMVLTTDLYLSNFLGASKPAGSYGSVEAYYQTDFGNSGYTFLKMLTPGTSYVSEAGATYLTELPAAVPEPQSWAMMIVGFGVVGGAMRSRRQAAQPKHITA
jgi:hypothetical protein